MSELQKNMSHALDIMSSRICFILNEEIQHKDSCSATRYESNAGSIMLYISQYIYMDRYRREPSPASQSLQRANWIMDE